MDIFLFSLGAIITIIIGIIGVNYTLKQKKTTKLLFLKNTCISLFETIVKNLEEIEIKYQGHKIGENLILFKGTIFNNGNVDIDKSIVHTPLTLKLPKNYSWVKYKVIDSSDGLNIKINQVVDDLVFEWDLLKEGEFFTFDCLVEYQSEENAKTEEQLDLRKDLIEKVHFIHRITNLKSIQKEKSIPSPTPIGALLLMSVIILGLVFVGFYFSAGQFVFPKYIMYQEVKIDSALNYAKIEPINNNTLKLIDQQGNSLLKISPEQYSQKSTNKLMIKKKQIEYISFCFAAFFGFIYFIMWLALIIVEINERKLYKKLKYIAEKYGSNDLPENKKSGFATRLFRIR